MASVEREFSGTADALWSGGWNEDCDESVGFGVCCVLCARAEELLVACELRPLAGGEILSCQRCRNGDVLNGLADCFTGRSEMQTSRTSPKPQKGIHG